MCWFWGSIWLSTGLGPSVIPNQSQRSKRSNNEIKQRTQLKSDTVNQIHLVLTREKHDFMGKHYLHSMDYDRDKNESIFTMGKLQKRTVNIEERITKWGRKHHQWTSNRYAHKVILYTIFKGVVCLRFIHSLIRY